MAYTWDNAMDEGLRRLALLERSLDPGTFRRLETIGVREGWRCLDVGGQGLRAKVTHTEVIRLR